VTSSFGNAERQDQIELVMRLQQNGSEITGSIGPLADPQVMTISNGRIEGNAVSFDVGNDQGKASIQFQLQGGKAEGRFRTSNRQGVVIQGTGTGQVQANRMIFQWSATRLTVNTAHSPVLERKGTSGDQKLQGKLEFTKAEK
jgi:hypothetical protein